MNFLSESSFVRMLFRTLSDFAIKDDNGLESGGRKQMKAYVYKC